MAAFPFMGQSLRLCALSSTARLGPSCSSPSLSPRLAFSVAVQAMGWRLSSEENVEQRLGLAWSARYALVLGHVLSSLSAFA